MRAPRTTLALLLVGLMLLLAAVSVFIFLIVAVISIVGFRRTRALEEVN